MKKSVLTKALSLLMALLLASTAAGCAAPKENTTFTAEGFDEAFFDYVAKNMSDENFMISPLSFRYALGLLLAGVKGNTESELLAALGIESIDEWTRLCGLFDAFIANYNLGAGEGSGISLANSIWKNEGMNFDLLPSYLNYTKTHFDAEHKTFTEAAFVPAVNGWVSEKTKGTIPSLLPDGYDTKDLAVALINALYFKGSWNECFDPSSRTDFTAFDGSVVKKTFLHKEGTYRYFADEETQLVIVPMEGGVDMTFVLGSTENLAAKIAKAVPTAVDITIPEMDFTTSLLKNELGTFLEERGVHDVFSSADADFRGMIDDPDISVYVDEILQVTRIKLDGLGVEASAATMISVRKTASSPAQEPAVIFLADRPFSFFIHAASENTTAVLFAGALNK